MNGERIGCEGEVPNFESMTSGLGTHETCCKAPAWRTSEDHTSRPTACPRTVGLCGRGRSRSFRMSSSHRGGGRSIHRQHQQKTSSMTQHETRRADNTLIVDTLGLPLHDACPRSCESGAGRRAPALTRRPRRLHSGWHVTTYEAHPDMACSMAEVMGRGARDSELGNADLKTRVSEWQQAGASASVPFRVSFA